jgi:hypothetical protein
MAANFSRFALLQTTDLISITIIDNQLKNLTVFKILERGLFTLYTRNSAKHSGDIHCVVVNQWVPVSVGLMAQLIHYNGFGNGGDV